MEDPQSQDDELAASLGSMSLAHPEQDLAASLRSLSIAQPESNLSSTLHSTRESKTAPPSPSPLLVRKSSNLGQGTNAQSPIRRQPSYPALSPTSSRVVMRSPSVASLSRSETASPLPPPAPLSPMTNADAETLVIVTDTSFLHRFSRPDADKAERDTIVERPERITAAMLGVSAAATKLPTKISIIKTQRQGSLSDPSVLQVHGDEYPVELGRWCDESKDKLEKRESEIPSGLHAGDLYLCENSRADMEGCIGAVWDGVDAVFGPKPVTGDFTKVKRAFICIRPPGHHCAEDSPSGFCFINNVHVAIARAAHKHGLTHAAILDFDLHHGDGSQTIAWSLNDRRIYPPAEPALPTIGYYSLHDINSYPCEFGDTSKVQNASMCIENAHGQNVWNVHLEKYSNEVHFWQLYENKYKLLLTKCRSFLIHSQATWKPSSKNKNKFKAGLFISAGFDASEFETPYMQRHKVNVMTEFFARFTSDVVALAVEYAGGRVLSVLEGGYSDRAIWSGTFSHLVGLASPEQVAPPVQETFKSRYESRSSPIGDIIGRKRESSLSSSSVSTQPSIEPTWDKAWFKMPSITEIEKSRDLAPRKPREPSNTLYYSPTASSLAKANATPPRLHRKSSVGLNGATSPRIAMRSPTPPPPPPPPPVDWPTATADLWRRLVPLEELPTPKIIQPKKPEVIVEKARRVSKRHSAVGIPAVDSATNAKAMRDRNETLMEDDEGATTTVGRRVSAGDLRIQEAPSAPAAVPKTRKVTPPRASTTRAAPVKKEPVAPKPKATTSRSTRPLSSNGTATTTKAVRKAQAITEKKETTMSRKPTMPPVTTHRQPTRPITSVSPPVADRIRSPTDTSPRKSMQPQMVKQMDAAADNLKSVKLSLTYKNKTRDMEQIESERRARENAEQEDISRRDAALEEQLKEEAIEEALARKQRELENARQESEEKRKAKQREEEVRKQKENAKKQEEEAREREEKLRRDQARQASEKMTQQRLAEDAEKARKAKEAPTQLEFMQKSKALAASATTEKPHMPKFTPQSKLLFAPNGVKFAQPFTAQQTASTSTPQKKSWQLGDELTPARVYLPGKDLLLGPHGTGQLGQDESLKALEKKDGVDMDLQ